MDPHQKLKQEYLKTQRASHAAWLEEQARHTVQRTTNLQHITSTNLYNHKDPDKITDNPPSNTQVINGPCADLSLPVDVASGSYWTTYGIRINITTPQEQMCVLTERGRTFSQDVATSKTAGKSHFIVFTRLKEIWNRREMGTGPDPITSHQ